MSAAKEIHAGWLTKRGAVRKSWKQRWFVVDHEKQMRYFPTDEALQCLGTIDLSQVLSIAPCDEKGVLPHSLSLTTLERVWILATDSPASLDKWLHMLEVCVGTAKRLVTSKEGYLKKKGKYNTNVKNRYFALGKGWLFYFGEEEDCHKFKQIAFFSEKVFRAAFFKYVRGSIPLDKASLERWETSTTRITISTPQRVFHIISKNDTQLEEWIDAIHMSMGRSSALPGRLSSLDEKGVESDDPSEATQEMDDRALSLQMDKGFESDDELGDDTDEQHHNKSNSASSATERTFQVHEEELDIQATRLSAKAE